MIPCAAVFVVTLGAVAPVAFPTEKAEKALADLVGDELFHQCFAFLPEESRFEPGLPDCATCADVDRKPHYLLLWSFRMAGKPFVDEQVLITVDGKGELPFEADGVPACKGTPALCTFAVDEAEALRIARQDHFEEGLEPWKTSFHFHYGFKRFVWSVSNLLERGPGDREEGNLLLIDATTGKILERGGWTAMS